MKKHSKVLVLLLAMCLMLTCIAGCGNGGADGTPTGGVGSGSSDSEGNTPAAGSKMVGDLEVPEGQQTVLNVGITSDPENLAPEAAMGSASFCKGVIYERLFDYNPLNISEIIPVMVESYEWLDDTHLQCTLFDHIFDTNGNQIKAEDAVWSVIHCKDTVYKQKAADIVDEETYAVDEYTFVIGYTTKNFLWSDNLAGIDIVSQKSFEESVDGMMTTPVGSGTYKLESYQDGSSMTLVRNENYWMTEEDAAKNGAYLHSQNISKIVFKIIPDATQQIIEFNAGTIDMLRQVPTVSLPDCMEDPTIDLFPAAATQMKYLYYNCSDDSQMKDVNLRRAVSYAINNDDIVVGGYDGFVNKSTQIVASWAQEYVEGWEPYPFDTAKAKECLAESNYNGEPLVIIYSAENPSDVVLAQIIMEELRAVGISSRIEEIETASFTSTQTQITTGWDICITAAKQTNTILFTYYNTLNVHANCRGHWNRYDTSGNAERFQELEDQALPDAVENFDLIKEAQAILEDQCVIYPMHEVTQYYGLRSGIDMDQLYVAPGNFYFGDFYPTADATWLLESAS